MNIKKKISEIVLLTLAVVVGGGYAYYSLLTDTGDSFNKNPVVVYNNTQIVGSKTRLGNISSGNRHRSPSKHINSISAPTLSGTQLPSAGSVPAVGGHVSGLLSGSTGYSYRYNAKTQDKSSTSVGSTGIGGMMAYGSRGRGNNSELAISGGSAITAPGAAMPYAVPKTPDTNTPPGNGIILVDPGTYTTQGDELGTQEMIPVGEGGWILLLLALGYVVWKKTGPLQLPRRVKPL